jgi:ParB family chromosome partitioning protein
MRIHTITLNALRPGHEFPGASINARSVGRAEDIKSLAASIENEGLLQSLLAVQAKDDAEHYYIADGNRRLAALQLLVKVKKIAKDWLVPVIVSDATDPETALRKSVTAGIQHVPLHAADQVENFTKCIKAGEKPEDIAERNQLPVKLVKQRIALGTLSPVILKAWRDGKIRIEDAQAYASSTSHAAQEKHFKKGGYEIRNPHSIRRAMIGDEHEIKKLLTFVGEAAYKKAGGALVEDLFGQTEGKHFADFALLQKLTSEKMREKAAEYVKAGWGWAAYEDDLPDDAALNWPAKSKPTKEEKAKLGVILEFDWNGKVEVTTGVIKPGVKGVKSDDGEGAPKDKTKKKTPGQISDALARELSETLTYGAGEAMARDNGETALAVAIAALASSGHMQYSHYRGDGAAVQLIETGLAKVRASRSNNRAFTSELAVALKLPLKDKLKTLAGIVGKAFDFQTHSANRPPLKDKSVLAVIETIDGKALNEAVRAKFQPDEYFGRISGALRLQAIREMAPDQESAVAKMKKGGQVMAAIAAFRKSTNWLPPELRTVHYAGPKAKNNVVKLPTKKKAKAATPKKKAA